ncbi:MAG: hypothetical protein RIS64_1205 [Bacteroidota bacterium]|jgi:dTDP-4-dehydrorhamnose 3,5-epimerase-like enzyme
MNAIKQMPYTQFKDVRGGFIGLMNEGNWKEINLVETKKGQSRGNHYHKNMDEAIFILSGQATVWLQNVAIPTEKTVLILNAMEGILIKPYMLHEFHYTEDTQHIAFLNQVFDNQNPDLHFV